MSFDALNRYSPNHKTWDRVGNMVPVVEASEGFRPHGEFKPAAWLPVQFLEKYYEEYYTVLPGKLLSTDNQGRLCPSQYGLSGAQITYTQTDVDRGVIDVRTGVALVSGGIGTFNVSAVSAFMGQSGVAMAVSKPIGVAPYAFYQWAGDGGQYDDGFNPAGFRQHNHNLQHRTAVLCDYVLELPLVPATTSSEAISEASYSPSTERSAFTALAALPVAKNTVRSPMTFANNTQTDASTRFVREVAAATDVVTPGDWHVNLTTGVITVHAMGSLGATAYSVTYYNYASAASTVSKFACVLGNIKAGDFLKCGTNSNWVEATPKTFGDGVTDNFDTFADIMGQVLEVESVYDKDALGRVRTAYNPALNTSASGTLPGFSGQLDQMPGSATGGVTDKVHYAGAADLVVRVNLISR